MSNQPEKAAPAASKPSLRAMWTDLLQRHRWIPFVLPFAVFMVATYLTPAPAPRAESAGQQAEPAAAKTSAAGPEGKGLAGDGAATEATLSSADGALELAYPSAYAAGVFFTALAIVLVWPTWRAIPWGCSWWAVAAGLVGGALWIGICRLKLEQQMSALFGLDAWLALGDRPSFDPYAALGAVPIAMVVFLAVRLLGLMVIVPLAEEFFLRGFLMRFIEKPEWWTVSMGAVTWKAAIAATVYGVLAHPAEMIAAALWFSLITLLYARTRSIWDCVIAHSITNGMLGVYILVFRDWTLW